MVEVNNVLLVIKKLRREPKSIWRLLKSNEFLSRKVVEDRVPDVFAVKISIVAATRHKVQ